MSSHETPTPDVTEADRRAVIDLMADGRPRSAAEIAAELASHPSLQGDEGRMRIYEVAETAPGFMTLDGERVFDVNAVLAGRVLPHRLTEEERTTGIVLLRPDIVPAALAAQAEPEGGGEDDDAPVPVRVAGLGEVSMVFTPTGGDVSDGFEGELGLGGGLALGAAALDAIRGEGEVIAARLQDGELHLSAAEHAEADAEAADSLRRHFDELRGDEESVGLTSLLVTWLIEDERALRRPGAPFAALVEAAALTYRGAWVGPEDEGWRTPLEIHAEELRERNAEVYRFDECCHRAYEEVSEAFLTDGGIDRDTVGRSLAHGEVAAAFLAEEFATAGHHMDDAAREIVDFATALLEVADAGSAPASLYVRATAHECLGQVANAEQDLRLALRLDPAHRHSLIASAGYLDDRGDARRALANLRRAGLDDDHPQIVRLQRIVAAEPPKVGRNEPCPCGSGRKFKACCIDRATVPTAVQAEWLYAKILGFTLHPARRGVVEHLAIHAIESDGTDEDPAARIQEDIRLAEIAAFEAGVVNWFAEERRALLPRHEHDLVEEWSAQPLSVFDVRSVDDGSVALTDRVSGNDVVASTFTFDEVAEGTTIVGRVLGVGSRAFLGGPICEVPDQEIDVIVALATAGDMSAHDWADWVGHIDAVADGRSGVFVRSEGHHHHAHG